MVVIENAWAKINYFLSVGARRNDGYHDIETLMQTISLCDIVTISIDEGEGITVTSNWGDIPTDAGNLAYRAAEVFLAHLGCQKRVSIHIEKKIPAAGGLAGGSADAAAVLRGMNRICGFPFRIEQLATMGNKFGSDIAFCVYGGLALCQGRGDLVTQLIPTPTYHFLIANSGEKVSTMDAYSMLDSREGQILLAGADECLAALNNSNYKALAANCMNSFEAVVLPKCPVAYEMLQSLAGVARFARMSGSGASVFGVFETKEEALLAQSKLAFPTWYAHTVFVDEV